MAETKKTTVEKKAPAETRKRTETTVLFTRENYMWMIIGGVIIAIGMLLMTGGKSETFDKEVVYSARRVTIAPILIVLGLVVEIYAIFRKPAVKS